MRNSTFRICTFSDGEGVDLAFLTFLRHLPAACAPIADGLFFTECRLREIIRHLFFPKSCLFGAKGDKKQEEALLWVASSCCSVQGCSNVFLKSQSRIFFG